MNINKDNYEAFFLDYFEGNLSSAEVEELFAFLEKHPEVKNEFEGFEMLTIAADDTIVFDGKDSLKKNGIQSLELISIENIDEYLVGELEGTLSVQDRNDLEQFLALNPQLEKERKLFGLTRLQADTSVIYEDKASLKHSVVPIRRIMLYSLAVAASLAILFGIFFTWNNNFEPVGIASNKNNNRTNLTIDKSISPANPEKLVSSNAAPQLASNTIKKYRKTVHGNASVEKNRAVESVIRLGPARNTDLIPTITAMASREVKSHDYVEPEFMFIRTSQMHRNECMELYYNVRLAEQIQYAQLNETDKNPERTIFNSLAARVGKLFNPKNNEVQDPNSNLSVWTFAELGVKTYNNIAQDNVKLDLQRDEEGKVVAYNLSGDKLDLQRDIHK